MFNKAVRKVATLSRMPGGGYAGVGLVMRGMDLSWRIEDADAVAEFYSLMPLPAGAISLYADQDTIVARNLERGKKRPSRELSRLAFLNDAPRQMAVAILRDRGVPVLELDTRHSVDDNLDCIKRFVGLPPAAADAAAA
jgi:hypothetical protein